MTSFRRRTVNIGRYIENATVNSTKWSHTTHQYWTSAKPAYVGILKRYTICIVSLGWGACHSNLVNLVANIGVADLCLIRRGSAVRCFCLQECALSQKRASSTELLTWSRSHIMTITERQPWLGSWTISGKERGSTQLRQLQVINPWIDAAQIPRNNLLFFPFHISTLAGPSLYLILCLGSSVPRHEICFPMRIGRDIVPHATYMRCRI